MVADRLIARLEAIQRIEGHDRTGLEQPLSVIGCVLGCLVT